MGKDREQPRKEIKADNILLPQSREILSYGEMHEGVVYEVSGEDAKIPLNRVAESDIPGLYVG